MKEIQTSAKQTTSPHLSQPFSCFCLKHEKYQKVYRDTDDQKTGESKPEA